VSDDNCSAVVTNDANEPYALGTTSIIYTATDGSGNTATCEQIITVEDNEDPTIICPADLTVDTDLGSCEATDISLGSSVSDDNCSVVVTNDATEPYSLGATSIIYTATDGSGNTATCEQTITVEDNEDPTISCPADLTVDTDTGSCEATSVNLGSEVSDDNCSVVVTNNSSEPYALGTTSVIYTATDGSGNTATCEQIITVEDNEDPTISCPADLTVDTDLGTCETTGVSLGSSVSDDNCSVVVTNDSSEPYALGTTSVIYTATDGSGNTATCEQTITVEDNEDPSISCPSDLTVDTDTGSCEATSVSLGSSVSDDNCSVVAVSYTHLTLPTTPYV